MMPIEPPDTPDFIIEWFEQISDYQRNVLAKVAPYYAPMILAKAEAYEVIIALLKQRKDDLRTLVDELWETSIENKRLMNEAVYVSPEYLKFWGYEWAYRDVGEMVQAWLRDTENEQSENHG